MHKKMVLVFVFCVVGAFVDVQDADAQAPRYRSPAGPTVSPNLNFFRRDRGVIDIYNTIVRPQRQLRQQVQLQTNVISRQSRQIQALQNQSAQSAPLPGTGSAAQFFYYSHYYNFGQRR